MSIFRIVRIALSNPLEVTYYLNNEFLLPEHNPSGTFSFVPSHMIPTKLAMRSTLYHVHVYFNV